MLTRSKGRLIEPVQLAPTRKKRPNSARNTAKKPIKDIPDNKEDSLNTKLDKLYEDIKSVPNYSAKITEFLRQHDTHGPYQRIKKKIFPRRRVISRYPFEFFMADLIEYPQFKYINRGYKYILVCIDCFTRVVWAVPMKEKSSKWSADAFNSIFKNFDEFPKNLVTDGGLEFFNSAVNQIFVSFGINHFKLKTKTSWKASMVERVIQTIKSRLEKYFAKSKTFKWIDVIDQIVQNYNNTPHRSIGMAPLAVNENNRDDVYKRLYPHSIVTTICKLKVGDKVRTKLEKSVFEKGYTKKWSDNIYVIESSRQSQGVCWYKIIDSEGVKVPGIWYYYNLILVTRYDSQSTEHENSKDK